MHRHLVTSKTHRATIMRAHLQYDGSPAFDARFRRTLGAES